MSSPSDEITVNAVMPKIYGLTPADHSPSLPRYSRALGFSQGQGYPAVATGFDIEHGGVRR